METKNRAVIDKININKIKNRKGQLDINLRPGVDKVVDNLIVVPCDYQYQRYKQLDKMKRYKWKGHLDFTLRRGVDISTLSLSLSHCLSP